MKWGLMHMLSALLHYQGLGNDKTIYKSYLSTYPVVAIVHGQSRQHWAELDTQAVSSVYQFVTYMISTGFSRSSCLEVFLQVPESACWVCTESNNDTKRRENEHLIAASNVQYIFYSHRFT